MLCCSHVHPFPSSQTVPISNIKAAYAVVFDIELRILSFAAVDALAQVSMKGAANCSSHSDVQNSASL